MTYGCRSTKSRKSLKSWNYAQKISAIGYILIGFFSSIVSGLLYSLLDSKTATIFSLIFLAILFLMGGFVVNLKLSKFNEKNID